VPHEGEQALDCWACFAVDCWACIAPRQARKPGGLRWAVSRRQRSQAMLAAAARQARAGNVRSSPPNSPREQPTQASRLCSQQPTQARAGNVRRLWTAGPDGPALQWRLCSQAACFAVGGLAQAMFAGSGLLGLLCSGLLCGSVRRLPALQWAVSRRQSSQAVGCLAQATLAGSGLSRAGNVRRLWTAGPAGLVWL